MKVSVDLGPAQQTMQFRLLDMARKGGAVKGQRWLRTHIVFQVALAMARVGDGEDQLRHGNPHYGSGYLGMGTHNTVQDNYNMAM